MAMSTQPIATLSDRINPTGSLAGIRRGVRCAAA